MLEKAIERVIAERGPPDPISAETQSLKRKQEKSLDDDVAPAAFKAPKASKMSAAGKEPAGAAPSSLDPIALAFISSVPSLKTIMHTSTITPVLGPTLNPTFKTTSSTVSGITRTVSSSSAVLPSAQSSAAMPEPVAKRPVPSAAKDPAKNPEHTKEPSSQDQPGGKGYRPRSGSAGFAVLVALHLAKHGVLPQASLSKDELIGLAQPHTDTPMAPPTGRMAQGNQYFSGFSCVGQTLIPKGLVQKVQGRFALTPSGEALARQLTAEAGAPKGISPAKLARPASAPPALPLALTRIPLLPRQQAQLVAGAAAPVPPPHASTQPARAQPARIQPGPGSAPAATGPSPGFVFLNGQGERVGQKDAAEVRVSAAGVVEWKILVLGAQVTAWLPDDQAPEEIAGFSAAADGPRGPQGTSGGSLGPAPAPASSASSTSASSTSAGSTSASSTSAGSIRIAAGTTAGPASAAFPSAPGLQRAATLPTHLPGTLAGVCVAEHPPVRAALPFPVSEYQLVMLVDTREKLKVGGHEALVASLQRKLPGCKVQSRQLPLGDVAWVASPGRAGPLGEDADLVLDLLVERKTISDLESSIVDDRWREQKLRMRTAGIGTVVYAIEGTIRPVDMEAAAGVDRSSKAVMTAAARGEVLDGVQIVECGDAATVYAAVHANLASRLPAILRDRGTIMPTFSAFASSAARAGKLNVCAQFKTALRLVHSCTPAHAQAVADEYGTPANFARCLSALPNVQEREAALVRLGVSRTAAANIVLLYGPPGPTGLK